jgi:hypothetical protein
MQRWLMVLGDGEHHNGDAMSSVLPLSVADAKLAERKAWRRYAEAKGDNWREAFAEWVEARDALLAAYAEEAASPHKF